MLIENNIILKGGNKMALHWNWNEKVGEAVISQTFNGKTESFVRNLYQGNALLIFMNEWTDNDGVDKYSLYSFWADKQHMKNCLGLNPKRKEENFNYFDTPECTLTELRLNKKICTNVKDIVDAVTKAFDNITIRIYSED